MMGCVSGKTSGVLENPVAAARSCRCENPGFQFVTDNVDFFAIMIGMITLDFYLQWRQDSGRVQMGADLHIISYC